MKKVVLLCAFLVSTSSYAKLFSTEFVQFQLPTGWECTLEGTEWLCQSDNKDRQKEAIIIMAAKERGSQDTLEGYTSYLKEKKTYTLPNRKSQVSEPRYTKLKVVNDTKWVDSLHLASEVPGFYTRYLATVKGDLGIAVTFSTGKDHYDSYQPVFEKVIESMRAFVIKKAQVAKYQVKKKDQNLLEANIPPGSIMTGPRVVQGQGEAPKKKQDDTMLYIVLGALVAGFIAFKKLKGGGKSGVKKKKKKKA